ncbi:hypothetical protein CPHO_06960 [Corynebacterium phocae]|uniref:Uncharacterized protein n=1 Tax=Corynebacterium phocae TaxID=161895 RepID=A0A1L7D6H2_9CORY|nr:hypothetical protein CPHO_06960 [Corynebacterium phocae]
MLVAGACALSGCVGPGYVAVPPDIMQMDPADIRLPDARSQNLSRFVTPQFADEVRVIEDPYGLETAELFFAASESLIIAEDQPAALARAATLAMSQRVPMVAYSDDNRRDINALIGKLGVKRVLLVGRVSYLRTEGALTVMQDPGTDKGLGQLTAFQFDTRVVTSPEEMVQAIAEVDPSQHVQLKTQWRKLVRDPRAEVGALPAQPPRDGQMAPVVIATPATSVPAAANARAFGAELRVMPTGNPLDSKAAFAMVVGLDGGNLVALGPDFGGSNLLVNRIRQGWSE